jgi:tetratricopeptide (TPR) repeat protein
MRLGELYRMKGKRDLAEKLFRRVAEMEPENGEAQLSLGLICLEYPDRRPEALEKFHLAARLLPDRAADIEQKYIMPLEKKLSVRKIRH